MYDFWYSLGVAVIQPALLDAIDEAGPVFDFLTDRLVIEIPPRELLPKAPSVGLLEPQPTTDVRSAIGKFLKGFAAAAPPVSIYTAGRFCQMMKIPVFDSGSPQDSSFRDIIALANQAYAAAIAGGLESQLPTFPAFLGLCMLDNLFVSALGNPTPEVKQIVSEFGIVNDPPSLEWQIANRFVKNPQFKRSTKLLMEGDNSSWGPGGESGGELALFWPGKAERAIP